MLMATQYGNTVCVFEVVSICATISVLYLHLPICICIFVLYLFFQNFYLNLYLSLHLHFIAFTFVFVDYVGSMQADCGVTRPLLEDLLS